MTRLSEGDDPLEIVQEVWIWPYEQIVYAQRRKRPEKWDVQNSLGLRDTKRSSNLGSTTRTSDSHQENNENLPNSEFSCFGWKQGKTEWKRKKKKKPKKKTPIKTDNL